MNFLLHHSSTIEQHPQDAWFPEILQSHGEQSHGLLVEEWCKSSLTGGQVPTSLNGLLCLALAARFLLYLIGFVS